MIVYVQLRFTARHCWPKAPDEVKYLRYPHRHEFHVRAGKKVVHSRQIEFIQLKEQLTKYCQAMYEGKEFELSCEDIAYEILNDLNLSFVDVSEDGENGVVIAQISK